MLNRDSMEALTREQYYVRGSTALLDAVGRAIHHIGNVHKYAREEDRPEKTLFVITTDGMENASRKYHKKQIKDMISTKKERYGWEFLFLAANIDAVEAAQGIGIRKECAVNYDVKADTVQMYAEVSDAICCFRGERPVDFASIEGNIKKRRGKSE